MAEEKGYQVGGEMGVGFGALGMGEKDELPYRQGVEEIRVSTTTKSDLDLKAKFAEEAHHYISECIRVADQKAAFLFAAGTAVVAFLFEKAEPLLGKHPLNGSDWLLIIAMCVVTISAVMAALVVRPRFLSKALRSYIFWEDVAKLGAKQYSNEMMKKNPVEFISSKFANCHQLSLLCHNKYLYLSWAIVVGLLGYFLTIVYILRPFLTYMKQLVLP
jgi:hypothetical protein